ncbi:MAG: MOSC domain-containing protein [Desertimonas sp.]
MDATAGLPVVELWRYPVKSMLGERLEHAVIGPAGIVGDRRWALFDRDTGLTLTARRVPELLVAQARLISGGDRVHDGDAVEIELPDGTVTADDAVLSRWLGRDVELRDATAHDTTGTYEIALDDDGAPTEHHDWVRWDGPTWSFHDSTRTQVSLVSTATVGAWDRRRFRANVILAADTPMIEDGWIGERLAAGTSVLEVTKPIDRCVMVTRPQRDGIERDLEVLTTINRERAGNLAIGALVSTPGEITTGDLVAPLPTAG